MKSMTDEELKQFAKDYCANLIFTSDNIRKGDENLIGQIFMILLLGDEKLREDLKNVGLVYEYLKEAVPCSVNGYPVFFSCRFMSKEDRVRAWEYVRKIEEATEKALE